MRADEQAFMQAYGRMPTQADDGLGFLWKRGVGVDPRRGSFVRHLSRPSNFTNLTYIKTCHWLDPSHRPAFVGAAGSHMRPARKGDWFVVDKGGKWPLAEWMHQASLDLRHRAQASLERLEQ